jgi:hypothetical protein
VIPDLTGWIVAWWRRQPTWPAFDFALSGRRYPSIPEWPKPDPPLFDFSRRCPLCDGPMFGLEASIQTADGPVAVHRCCGRRLTARIRQVDGNMA